MESTVLEPQRKKAHPTNGLEDQLDVKELLSILSLVKNGKLDVRMPVTQAGINGRICEVLNDIIEMNERLVAEISSAEITISKGIT